MTAGAVTAVIMAGVIMADIIVARVIMADIADTDIIGKVAGTENILTEVTHHGGFDYRQQGLRRSRICGYKKTRPSQQEAKVEQFSVVKAITV